MRTKNTIEPNLSRYTIGFTDIDLFDLFLNYVKGSTINEMQGLDKPISVYDYYIEKDEFVDSKALTISVGNHMGVENVIGKFFLETDLDLPDNFADEYFIPEYKQPTEACPKAKDYGRGVGKILLGRVGKATVPKEIISKLQLREESEIIKAVIQKAHQELLTQCSLIFINDLLIIVLDYLTPEDNVQMVTTVVGEAKLSFFAQQVPKGDIALLKYVLTPLIGIRTEWKKMRHGEQPLGIKIGTNKSSQRPALATRGKKMDFSLCLITTISWWLWINPINMQF